MGQKIARCVHDFRRYMKTKWLVFWVVSGAIYFEKRRETKYKRDSLKNDHSTKATTGWKERKVWPHRTSRLKRLIYLQTTRSIHPFIHFCGVLSCAEHMYPIYLLARHGIRHISPKSTGVAGISRQQTVNETMITFFLVYPCHANIFPERTWKSMKLF